MYACSHSGSIKSRQTRQVVCLCWKFLLHLFSALKRIRIGWKWRKNTQCIKYATFSCLCKRCTCLGCMFLLLVSKLQICNMKKIDANILANNTANRIKIVDMSDDACVGWEGVALSFWTEIVTLVDVTSIDSDDATHNIYKSFKRGKWNDMRIFVLTSTKDWKRDFWAQESSGWRNTARELNPCILDLDIFRKMLVCVCISLVISSDISRIEAWMTKWNCTEYLLSGNVKSRVQESSLRMKRENPA